VVGEKDHKIEGRRIGPMQILQDEQHGDNSRAIGDQRERLLKYLKLRAGRLAIDLPESPERTQSLDERLIRQLSTDQVDRPTDEHLARLLPGTRCELRHEPRLA